MMNLNFEFDEASGVIRCDDRTISISDPEAFELVSKAWLRCGWDTKYVYGFSWLGRPVIQLPEDMIRIQEVIYAVKPDVILETGVAHGGSLVYYASLCTAIGKGRVIGVDIDIRKHNREAIEGHRLNHLIQLYQGSSTDPNVVNSVRQSIGLNETVLVLLDSNHSKAHVADELEYYCSFVSPGSYIVACDGIMEEVAGAPRTESDWSWNNPKTAVNDFLATHNEFNLVEPTWPFNEGYVRNRVTYWPRAFLQRR